MINSVSNLNTAGTYNSPFKDKESKYFLNSKKDIERVKEGGQEGKTNKLSKTVAIGALVAGFGSLALIRGFASKGAGKYLAKLKLKLEQKIANIKAGKTASKFEEFYIISLRAVDSFMKKSESINNITSWKDVGFQRLMWGKNGNFKFTRKIHESVTKLFERIGRNTVINSYGTTNKKFEKFFQHLEGINSKLDVGSADKVININGVEKTLKEWIADAASLRTTINTNMEAGFGKDARISRYRQMRHSVSGLFDYFWSKNFKSVKSLYSKDVWQTFIADDYIKADKMAMGNNVARLRQAITHDVIDNYKATTLALDNIDNFLDPADRSSREIVRKIRNHLTAYKKLSGTNEAIERQKLNEQILKELKSLSDNYKELFASQKYKYNEDSTRQVTNYINEVSEVISQNKKGPLQELLTIYKAVLPREDYIKLKKEANKAVKSLDKSIDLETVQFYDKLRDLVLGSAPTDVLSILFSIGAIGYGLTKADNKDDRISVTLKSGIPVVAAVGTSLYCSAGLVSGSKAMLVGLLSGAVMNKVGVYVDDFRKNIKAKQSQENQNQVQTSNQMHKIQPKTV